MATTFPSGFQLRSVCGDSLCCREAELSVTITFTPGGGGFRGPEDEVVAVPTHLDAVGVSDELVDVRGLAAQLRRVVLQDDALAGAAVKAVGRLSSRCT